MRTRFRTRLFAASLATSAAALAIATAIVARELRIEERTSIERRLTDQALLIAELLSHLPDVTSPELDEEADRLAESVGGRVTLIDAGGRVAGDSTLDGAALDAIENHADRPEVAAARRERTGIVERYSTTAASDMLYVAVPANHPEITVVRVAMPLTAVANQVKRVGWGALIAFALAAPVAVGLAWVTSLLVGRRVDAIAEVARRFTAGETAVPSRDYGDDEIGTVARALDGSVRQLGERVQELTSDRARTDAILTGMVEGVLVIDRQGRLQLVNRAAQQMLHVDGPAAGRPYVEVVRHPDIAAMLGAALDGHNVERGEIEIARAEGHTFLGRAAPVSTVGGGGAVLVLHDITDLRRADQMRRDFVANVSHELRTPLTAIRGYVDALMEDSEDRAQTRRFLEVIARQSGRMERLVTDLLRLARLDARQEVLELAQVDLAQLFRNVVADLGPTIDGKRQRATIVVSPDAGSISADAAKLYDIVRNLVENAANYSPEEAEIQLRAARDRDSVSITVSDSGPGVPAADLSRVFERFYRVDKSRARPGGTGLGLAIVRHLTELHGGTVSAANRPEGGAVFTITLPASADAARPDAHGPANSDRPRR